MDTRTTSRAAFSIPSIIAVLAAVFSFMVGAFFGLILAGVAIVSGAIGIVLSLAPGTRGGMASSFGVLAGVVGVIAAIVKAVMWVAGAR